jgi:hypothetical protein
MRKVPDYARVPRDEYIELRREVENFSRLYGFEFRWTWDLVISTLDRCHQKFLAGDQPRDMTLREAVEGTHKQVAAERSRRRKIADEAVRTLRRAREDS